MKKFNLWLPFSLVEIVGEVTRKEVGVRADHSAVTMYDLLGDDGVVYTCALNGVPASPSLGDKVKVHLVNQGYIVHKVNVTQQKEDGSSEVVSKLVTWLPIKRYQILEERV